MNNNPVFSLHTQYILLAGCMFLTEMVIATMVHDQFIRPVVGDFLIVIFLYCVVRGISDIAVYSAATGVLLFAFLIETTQYFHLIRLLGWENVRLARLVIGTQFSWVDISAYTAGIAVVLVLERKLVAT